MSPHQLAAFAIRLFVLWYALFLFRQLPLSFLADLEQTGTIVPVKAGVAVVLVLLIFVLWFTAGFPARLLVPKAVTESPPSWSESQVLTVGSSLIGLCVISYSMHPIIYYGTLWFLSSGNEMPEWQNEHTVSLLSALAVFVVGVWLFLGASGLWKIWARLRGRSDALKRAS